MANKNVIRDEIDKIIKHIDTILVDMYNVVELLRANNLEKEADYFENLGATLFAMKDGLADMYHYF